MPQHNGGLNLKKGPNSNVIELKEGPNLIKSQLYVGLNLRKLSPEDLS